MSLSITQDFTTDKTASLTLNLLNVQLTKDSTLNLYTVEATKTACAIDEVEFILQKKPQSNQFKIPFTASNIVFLKQTSLTLEFPQKECSVWTPTHVVTLKGEEARRPENVIDSLAVYYTGKALGSTGKLCHIYRPEAVDAKGNHTWGTIDAVDSMLIVTIPQAFLDSAVYPVIVDPTFGYTDIGETEVSTTSDEIRGSLATCSEAGTATAMRFYNGATRTSAFNLGLYLASDDSFVAGTAQETSVVSDWNTAAFASPPAVSAQNYWVVYWGESVDLQYDGGAAGSGFYMSQAYPGDWPATLSRTAQSRIYSIYALYDLPATGQQLFTLINDIYH